MNDILLQLIVPLLIKNFYEVKEMVYPLSLLNLLTF